MTEQQRWNRYVRAINHCMLYGFLIDCIDRKDKKGEWNGGVKAIKVSHLDSPHKTVIIPLEPRKYKPQELLMIIIQRYGKST